MNIQEEIFRSIENLAKPNSPIFMDFPTVIFEVGKDAYKVKINGIERMAKNGTGLEFKVGDAVWCHAMNGNIGQLYIICRR